MTVTYQRPAVAAGRDYLSLAANVRELAVSFGPLRGVTLPDRPATFAPFTGTTGNDSFTGTGAADTFNMTQGGKDKVLGKAGDDSFTFGAELAANDKVDGGADTFLMPGGSNLGDVLDLSGDYSGGVTFKASTVVDIETLRLALGNTYHLMLHDGTVAAGGYMNINYLGNSAAFFVHLDASAETDGDVSFGGGPGNDILIGGGGNDLLRPRNGTNDVIDGGDGFDRVSWFGATNGVTVNLNLQGSAQNTGFGTVTMDNIEDIAGTGHADTLTGDSFGNWILGNGGDDTVLGGQGDDIVEVGGKGANGMLATNVQVDGEGGTGDMMSFLQSATLGSPGGVTVTLATNLAQVTGQGTISIIRVENLQGTTFDDTLTGNDGDNVLFGSEGNDTLSGGDANDTLWGDKTLLVFDGNPTDGPRILFDPDAPGTDTMDGGLGNDTLIGDLLSDTMTGGTGADTFVYEEAADSISATGIDHITDLNGAEDLFQLWFEVTGVDTTVAAGKLRASNFDTDMGKAIKPAKLGADHAVVFTPDSGTLVGNVYLVIDANSTKGYQAGDVVIDITGAVNLGSLNVSDFVTV